MKGGFVNMADADGSWRMLTDACSNRTWSIYTTGRDLARKGFPTQPAARTNVADIMVSEISQLQKNRHHLISLEMRSIDTHSRQSARGRGCAVQRAQRASSSKWEHSGDWLWHGISGKAAGHGRLSLCLRCWCSIWVPVQVLACSPSDPALCSWIPAIHFCSRNGV